MPYSVLILYVGTLTDYACDFVDPLLPADVHASGQWPEAHTSDAQADGVSSAGQLRLAADVSVRLLSGGQHGQHGGRTTGGWTTDGSWSDMGELFQIANTFLL